MSKPSDSYRILHTADWHLGKTLEGQSREEEHDLFLAWLLESQANTKSTQSSWRVAFSIVECPRKPPFTVTLNLCFSSRERENANSS